jgi:hypothetical protein
MLVGPLASDLKIATQNFPCQTSPKQNSQHNKLAKTVKKT